MQQPFTAAAAFDREPAQWGLRGDPYLWREMRTQLDRTPLPRSEPEAERLLERTFKTLTGRTIETPEPFVVPKYAHGGMSSGQIDPQFWRTKALPLLVRQWFKLLSASLKPDFVFSFSDAQRHKFREGTLIKQWAERYPMLFDDDDLRVLDTSQQRNYHFLEWLSAVLIFESTGYQSFVEKYTAKSHSSKRAELARLLPQPLFDWLTVNESGQPDLFVYSPESGDWFFCEVKGPSDSIRPNQFTWAERLRAFLPTCNISTPKRVRMLSLSRITS